MTKISFSDLFSVSSQKLGGNRKALEGAKRPTAGDEACEFTSHAEGGRRGRVPSFIEKSLFSEKKTIEKFNLYLKGGGIAIIPTDTLYGFAVDGNSILGVKKLYKIKAREAKKPLILFLQELKRVSDIGIDVKEPVLSFLKRHWPGPLTAVFPFQPVKGLKAFSFENIGIRIPAHDELLQFIAQYPGFLLSTSANLSGESPIFDPSHLERNFKDQVSWLIDGGVIPLTEPSTVADMRFWPPHILRQGKAKW